MARPLTFTLDGQPYTVELGSKVYKKDLYGYAKTMREKDGKPLTRGYLSPDGRLLPHGTISLIKSDPIGTPVEEPVIEIQGKPAEKLPSSFDRENPLYKAQMSELVGFCIKDCYPLNPLAGLNLTEGLYRTTFAYRSNFQYVDAYILIKPLPEGNFEPWLLIGVRKQSALLGQAVIYEFFDAEADDESDDEEEMDFAMV